MPFCITDERLTTAEMPKLIFVVAAKPILYYRMTVANNHYAVKCLLPLEAYYLSTSCTFILPIAVKGAHTLLKDC